MDEKPKVDVGKIVQDALAKQGVEKVESEVPTGFAIVPLDKISRVTDTSARLKDIPGLVDAAKRDPAVMRGVEDLGRNISDLAAAAIQKRAFGGKKEDGEPGSEPSEPQESQGIIVLAGLATVGAIFLIKRLNEKKEAEAQAAAQAAMLAAQEAEKQENWAKLSGSNTNNTGVQAVPSGAGSKGSGSPIPGQA